MSQTLSQKLLPTTFELWCVGLVSIAILFAGNSQALLDKLGILNSSSVVHENVTSALQNGLTTLDGFTVTPSLVTFLVWAAIGLIVFSVLQAFARASGVVEFERDIGSNRYVHPANFSRRRYWAHILSDSILSFAAFVGLISYSFIYLLFVLPVGLTYARSVTDSFSLISLGELAIGSMVIFVGTFTFYMFIEIIVWRHRLSNSTG